MKIVDVCAFYTPLGGGVKTYIQQKLAAGPKLGHEIIILAPGEGYHVEKISPQARIVTIPGRVMPLDPRYYYFEDAASVHSFLNSEQPDFVEASSPWRSASIVGEWQADVPRALIMHADPLSAYAYRWLGRLFSRSTIDRQFDWFWRHLKRLDTQFDMIISACENLTGRLRSGGLRRVQSIPMGIEPGIFSPHHRNEDLRRKLLARCALGPDGILLLGVGRHAPEKRWSMIVDAATKAGHHQPVGLILVGDGRDHSRILKQVKSNPHIHLLAPITDRHEMASLMASCDVLIHGCEAETFCMVGAEARASGLPIIAPDLGAAADQCQIGSGAIFTSGDVNATADAISKVVSVLEEQRTSAVRRAVQVATIDDHFMRLFRCYEQQEMRYAA